VPGVNGFAIASLILAICGGLGITLVLSIAFGIVALVQLKTRDQRGKGLAVAGLSVAGLWIVTFGVAIAVAIATGGTAGGTGSSTRDVATAQPTVSPTAEGTRVALTRLKVGDCIEDVTEGKSVVQLTLVACTQSHEAEVVARFDLPAGAYPGDSVVDEQSATGCADRLEAYAPGSSDDPDIDLFYFSPLEAEWTRYQGRNVICMAVRTPPTTGSVKS
jgi:hypothetical protein